MGNCVFDVEKIFEIDKKVNVGPTPSIWGNGPKIVRTFVFHLKCKIKIILYKL